jgi:oxepin-CoA hydrolase/3-oxo-5,6-dehydrosuberyl-CoA semialdehyde dehydrogenase
MGALVGLDQRRDVEERLSLLSQQCETVFGDFGSGNSLSIVGENTKGGAFISPVLLACNSAAHDPDSAVHNVEAFGPVSTLIPYENDDDAIAIAAMGKGSLVGSVVTANPEVARSIVLGCAAYHGRMVVINEACAKESTGHGSPLAHLVHGGPGRAGGCEEMGGIRGVKHYMQRTAIQGSPDMLGAITDTWITGAKRNDGGIHPFKKTFEILSVGDALTTEKRVITLEDIETFAELSGDTFYAHMDKEAAKRNPFFEDRVAHGYFLVSMAAGLFVWPEEGPVLANYGLDNLRFSSPVYAGDELQVEFTCKQKVNRDTEEYGEVRWDTTIINQEGEVVANYDVLTLVAKANKNEQT